MVGLIAGSVCLHHSVFSPLYWQDSVNTRGDQNMDHRYALSSRAQERTKSPHKPTTRDQATESPASFDRQAFHATNGKPGESEASGRHGDTLRDPSIRGISREGSVICVIADDHQLAIFDAL